MVEGTSLFASTYRGVGILIQCVKRKKIRIQVSIDINQRGHGKKPIFPWVSDSSPSVVDAGKLERLPCTAWRLELAVDDMSLPIVSSHETRKVMVSIVLAVPPHQQIVQMLARLNLAYMNLITFQLIFDLRYFLPSMSSSLKQDSK